MGLNFRPGGVGIYTDEFKCVEVHSSTCAHCQHLTEFPSRRKMMDHVDICRSCMRLICLPCVGRPCHPWLKQCEIEEAMWRHRLRAGT